MVSDNMATVPLHCGSYEACDPQSPFVGWFTYSTRMHTKLLIRTHPESE